MKKQIEVVQPNFKATQRSGYLSKLNTLSSEIFLTLQTRHAQALVRGRDTPGHSRIVGLVSFADRVRLIWNGAQNNDPYADWWLIKIEDSINTSLKTIDTKHEEVKAKLETTRAMRITPAESKDPFRLELRFGTPYAFRAATMLGNFDALVTDALTAKHIGEVTSTECQNLIFDRAQKIRSTFNMPFMYRFLNIDRARPTTWEGVRTRAERLMGVLPDDIAVGKRRATLAPAIKVGEPPELPAMEVSDTAVEAVFGT